MKGRSFPSRGRSTRGQKVANLCRARSQPQEERPRDAQRLRAGPPPRHAWGVRLPRAVPAAPDPRGTGLPAARGARAAGRRRLQGRPLRPGSGGEAQDRGARRGAGGREPAGREPAAARCGKDSRGVAALATDAAAAALAGCQPAFPQTSRQGSSPPPRPETSPRTLAGGAANAC